MDPLGAAYGRKRSSATAELGDCSSLSREKARRVEPIDRLASTAIQQHPLVACLDCRSARRPCCVRQGSIGCESCEDGQCSLLCVAILRELQRDLPTPDASPGSQPDQHGSEIPLGTAIHPTTSPHTVQPTSSFQISPSLSGLDTSPRLPPEAPIPAAPRPAHSIPLDARSSAARLHSSAERYVFHPPPTTGRQQGPPLPTPPPSHDLEVLLRPGTSLFPMRFSVHLVPWLDACVLELLREAIKSLGGQVKGFPHEADLVIIDPRPSLSFARALLHQNPLVSSGLDSGRIQLRDYDWLARSLSSGRITATLSSRVFVNVDGSPTRIAVEPSRDQAFVREMVKVIGDNSGLTVRPDQCTFIIVQSRPDMSVVKSWGCRSGTVWCTKQWALESVACGSALRHMAKELKGADNVSRPQPQISGTGVPPGLPKPALSDGALCVSIRRGSRDISAGQRCDIAQLDIAASTPPTPIPTARPIPVSRSAPFESSSATVPQPSSSMDTTMSARSMTTTSVSTPPARVCPYTPETQAFIDSLLAVPPPLDLVTVARNPHTHTQIIHAISSHDVPQPIRSQVAHDICGPKKTDMVQRGPFVPQWSLPTPPPSANGIDLS